MIQPQYISALIDFDILQFNIHQFKDDYIFICEMKSTDIKLLYKIKKRFKSGKIISLENIFLLKITKDLDKLILFIRHNPPFIAKKHANFLRWAYLYQKLIIEKSIVKTDKELRRISRRLKCFGL